MRAIVLVATLCACSPDPGGPSNRPTPPRSHDAGPPRSLPDAGFDECLTATVTADAIARPVDMIWVIDSSGSMDEEAGFVQDNLNLFSSEVGASGLDPHVVVITTSEFVTVPPPLGTDAEHYLFIEDHVGSNEPLQKLVDHFGSYSGFLRPDALTQFIAVTDDESDLSAPEFTSRMSALLGREYTFHAIASEDVGGGRECDGAAAVGAQYWQLAMETGGEQISICTTDWTLVFDRLLTAILEDAPLPCVFDVPAAPGGTTVDPTRVNVIHTAADGSSTTIPFVMSAGACAGPGWYYDDPVAPTKIELCDASCSVVGTDTTGRIDIALGCAAVLE
jgi:hypothetical protein